MNLALAYNMSEAPIGAASDVADADGDLVRQALAGQLHAFERLYRRHVGRVHGAIRRLVGGHEARAQELTQDAFVRVWQKLDSYRFESAFGTWVYRLAVNVALMDLRGRAGAEDREETLDDEALSLGAASVRGDLRIDLERAVAKLPPRARAVLVLHDIEGWRHEDIAQELTMAVGSSKAQLHRARQLLRRHLGEAHE
jgi:RNA polymerase sigma-70 factor (ECF subfamily)